MYEYIYFCGGGTRLIYFYMSLLFHHIYEYQTIHKDIIKSFIGSSAGGVGLFVFLISETANDYIWIMNNFRAFNYVNKKIEDIINCQGFINRKKSRKFLENFLKMKGYSPTITLEEVFRKVNFYFGFSVYDFIKKESILLNPIDYGYIQLVDAVMWSHHIPFLIGTEDNRYLLDGAFDNTNSNTWYQKINRFEINKYEKIKVNNGFIYRNNNIVYLETNRYLMTHLTRKPIEVLNKYQSNYLLYIFQLFLSMMIHPTNKEIELNNMNWELNIMFEDLSSLIDRIEPFIENESSFWKKKWIKILESIDKPLPKLVSLFLENTYDEPYLFYLLAKYYHIIFNKELIK